MSGVVLVPDHCSSDLFIIQHDPYIFFLDPALRLSRLNLRPFITPRQQPAEVPYVGIAFQRDLCAAARRGGLSGR